jgi:hypothetical protein
MVVSFNLVLKKAFDLNDRNRFNNNIFLNKNGPRFGCKKDTVKNEKKKIKMSENRVKPEQSAIDEIKKNKFKESYMNVEGGFSLGIAPSKLNLKNKRKEQYKNTIKEYEELMYFNNINYPRRAEASDDSIVRDRKDTYLSNNSPYKQFGYQDKVTEFKLESKKSIDKLERVKSLKKKREEIERKRMEELKTSIEIRNSHRTVKPLYEIKEIKKMVKEPEILPGPASYDVRGGIEKRGFSFGRRNYISIKEKPTPDFVLPKTDIENILDRPKFACTKSDRFKKDPEAISRSNDLQCKLP